MENERGIKRKREKIIFHFDGKDAVDNLMMKKREKNVSITSEHN